MVKNSKTSILSASFLDLGLNTKQTPPPPRLAAEGRLTERTKYIAVAASAAVPPLFSTRLASITDLGSSPDTPAKLLTSGNIGSS